MKQLFILSKENISLAKEEVLSLAKPKAFELFKNILILETDLELHSRLGYTHKIFRHIFSCKASDIAARINKFDWNTIYEESLCVRIHDMDTAEKDIARLVFNQIEKAKIDLKNPKTKIEFFQVEDTIICGMLISDVDKSHLKRKAHLRPSLHPTSMNPALAKACINLTGLRRGTIIDPFCGSGGILIEASLMGFEVIGYDIDEKQIKRAKMNMDFYNAKAELLEQDALSSTKRADAIVTDIPYGKGSKVNDIKSLCSSFLKHSKKLTETLILIYPDFMSPDFKGWKIENEYTIYIHKSLTRKIVKLRDPHSVS